MSLNFDVSAIENHAEVTTLTVDGEDRWHPLTNALVFICIPVKLGKITADNAAEFYARANMIERMDGAYRRDGDGKPVYVTPEDVRSHIGLTVNVADESRAKFLAQFRRELDRLMASYTKAVA